MLGIKEKKLKENGLFFYRKTSIAIIQIDIHTSIPLKLEPLFYEHDYLFFAQEKNFR